MDAPAELESGAQDRGGTPAPSTSAVPVQQVSLWSPPRSVQGSARRRRRITGLAVGAAAVVLIAGGTAAAWALIGDGAEDAPAGSGAPAEDFVGSWAGEMTQVDTEGAHVADWHAEVRIEDGAERGSTAWTTFTCSGTLELTAADNDRRVFTYTETADPEERCVDEAELTVWPGGGGLNAEWSSVTREGTRMISTGLLSGGA
ncbi:hypothetical protein ACFVWN_19135 [Nocardiopsis flavescens]|uniref:Uncharacterized protein n=1 Tax=Nocardiopsis flavescens TaxID=758803 RepID=A0A1M6FUP2_9ACTN|nr:hypothetical protein [Nocardiopsis flavescens]SHJ01373.1 hypothetical protein SAMN05421803_103156 [Nocardiopsis flavescens]